MYYDERDNYFDYIAQKSDDILNTENINILDNKENTNITIGNLSINNYSRKENNILSPIDALNKGNLFKDLYSNYKNHIYSVIVKGKRDEMLLNVQALGFLLKDLNLYLDVFPDDKDLLFEFNHYNKEYKKVKSEYESEFGPLCVNAENNDSVFNWVSSPWPWDNGGIK